MKKVNPVHIVIILLAFGLSGYFLKDSIMFYSKNAQQREEHIKKDPNIFKRIINLGLDLQGGMSLILEIDRSKLDADAQKDVLDRAYTIIENRINGLGVAEPSIQKQGTERLVVELPGLRDEKMATNVIGSTAQLQFHLLREPTELTRAVTLIDDVLKGKAPVDSTDTSAAQSDTTSEKKKDQQVQAQQLFQGQESDSSADSTGDSTATVKKSRSLSGLLAANGEQIAVLDQNKADVDEILARKDVTDALQRAGLAGNLFVWGHETKRTGASVYRSLYYVKARPELKGDAVSGAQASIAQGGMQQGQAIVELQMTRAGGIAFSKVTGRNVNKFLAIVLDNTVYSAPVIRAKISGGRAQIEGSFSMEEAKNLAVVLRAGALPAPVTIVDKRTVGPSLGEDSIKLGYTSFIVALILVLIFIVVYYKLSGCIAVVAMLLNLLLVFAIMAGINQTLTLPGIAGLVLIIGMSVDANVLIFERIREELKAGKTVRSAIDAGYHRAFYAIFDSNVTTLITGFILFEVGSGPIKGFAITLMFGLIANFFTAVYATRVIFNLMTQYGKKETLSI